MAVKITNSTIIVGHWIGGDFGPSCQQGDWLTSRIDFSSATFTPPLPTFSSVPRVIVTPIQERSSDFLATPVCVVRDLSTDGFTLAARNAARDRRGSAAFNWLAVLETPGVTGTVPQVHFGCVLPQTFAPSGGTSPLVFDDHAYFDLPPGGWLDTEVSSVQLTATNLAVKTNNVAAVGIIYNPPHIDQLALEAHNTDIVGGECALYWASFLYSSKLDPAGTQPEPGIETGELSGLGFSPSGQPSDTVSREVFFNDPFVAPPVVVLTANNLGVNPGGGNPAVVGIAQDVTPYGFRLKARNSDCGGGVAGFYWVAIGWLPK